MKMDAVRKTGSRRSSGFALLRQVYEELYTHLGEEYSASDLLRAAQTLIEVTDEEYAEASSKDQREQPGYYSFEVDWMFDNRQWWLYDIEQREDHLGDDRLSENYNARQRLKKLYNPDPYVHRG